MAIQIYPNWPRPVELRTQLSPSPHLGNLLLSSAPPDVSGPSVALKTDSFAISAAARSRISHIPSIFQAELLKL